MKTNIGIIGIGTYIPKGRVTAKEIRIIQKVDGQDAVISKLGVIENQGQLTKKEVCSWS